jgi:hypothetical protein
MKAIDYRNITWASLQGYIVGLRAEVLDAYRRYGPGTTREIAAASGIDILTLRPRVTELIQLGYLELANFERSKSGTYQAVSDEDRARRFETHRELMSQQTQFELALQ